jgi:hypothetical protein
MKFNGLSELPVVNTKQRCNFENCSLGHTVREQLAQMYILIYIRQCFGYFQTTF